MHFMASGEVAPILVCRYSNFQPLCYGALMCRSGSAGVPWELGARLEPVLWVSSRAEQEEEEKQTVQHCRPTFLTGGSLDLHGSN